MAKSIEKKTGGGIIGSSVFPDVTLFKIFTVIIKTILKIVSTIVLILTTLFTFLFWIFVWVFTVLCIIGGTLFFPAIFGICVYFAVSFFWDGGARPMLSIVQSGLNFVIDLWNSVVKALRKFGVRLDTADGFGQNVPTFWEFIKYIIYTVVWRPIELALKGSVFR